MSVLFCDKNINLFWVQSYGKKNMCTIAVLWYFVSHKVVIRLP